MFSQYICDMNREEILDFMRKNKGFLEEKMGVKRIALFGSVARGEMKKGSDIDIIVELKEPKYSLLYNLLIYLEKNINAPIDLVRKGPHLGDKFLKSIEKEMIYV